MTSRLLFSRFVLVALGGVLVFASFSKLFDAGSFVAAVAEHGIVPLNAALAYALIALEWLIGAVALLAAVGRSRSLQAAAFLLCATLFTFLCVYALAVIVTHTSSEVPCACGVSLAHRIGGWKGTLF